MKLKIFFTALFFLFISLTFPSSILAFTCNSSSLKYNSNNSTKEITMSIVLNTPIGDLDPDDSYSLESKKGSNQIIAAGAKATNNRVTFTISADKLVSSKVLENPGNVLFEVKSANHPLDQCAFIASHDEIQKAYDEATAGIPLSNLGTLQSCSGPNDTACPPGSTCQSTGASGSFGGYYCVPVNVTPGSASSLPDFTCPSQFGSKGVDTALGCLPSEPSALALWVLTWAVRTGGGLAFLLSLWGAITIILAGGDPEKINQGKQIITAAISGLIFIILSIFLLRLIGYDILKIPGFSK